MQYFHDAMVNEVGGEAELMKKSERACKFLSERSFIQHRKAFGMSCQGKVKIFENKLVLVEVFFWIFRTFNTCSQMSQIGYF
jgi:hypothetical protein